MRPAFGYRLAAIRKSRGMTLAAGDHCPLRAIFRLAEYGLGLAR
jgi:hypothetical protein